jgi:hypothetical protein
MDEQAIPRDQIESVFKSIKKEMDASIIKIYDDGAIKVIDNYGVITNYDTYQDFLKFARKKFGVGV